MASISVRIRVLAVITLTALFQAYAQDPQHLPAQEDTADLRLANARFFTEYSDFTSISSLLRMPENANVDPIVITRTLPAHTIAGSGLAPERSTYLHLLAANADLIATGRPISSNSSLTEDKTFIFTDYVFQIDQVEFDPSHNIRPGDRIVVAKAGGSLSLDGRTIRAVDPDFKDFTIGARYTLFLHALPGGNAFKAYADGTFIRAAGLVASGRRSTSFSKGEAEFSEDVNSAIAATRR